MTQNNNLQDKLNNIKYVLQKINDIILSLYIYTYISLLSLIGCFHHEYPFFNIVKYNKNIDTECQKINIKVNHILTYCSFLMFIPLFYIMMLWIIPVIIYLSVCLMIWSLLIMITK